MPKDYKNINKKNTKTQAGSTRVVVSFFTGLAIGIMIAAFIYVRDYSITELSIFQAKDTDTGNEHNTKDSHSLKDSIPEPTFDFYTVLPNREINISEYIAEDDDEVVTMDENEEEFYIFQVGSFENFSAADQVKAKLALIGISAEIQRVVINGQDSRHRVRVGPFKEPIEINEIRKRLYANNLEFMLLKLRIDASENG